MEDVDTLFLTHAGRELVWKAWDGVFIVYQPSSAETHVFNDTTAAILQSLEDDALTMAEIADRTGQSPDPEHEQASGGNLFFALQRLEELGLIDWSARVPAA